MHDDIYFMALLAITGILLMVYASVFCRKMQAMGESLPRRVAGKLLGEEATPAELAEALGDLRRRLRLAGLALLSLSIILLACAFLLAWLFTASSRPLILVGLAVLALSLSLSTVMVMDNIPLQ